MSAYGWLNTGHRFLSLSFLRRVKPRKPLPHKATPGLESLEKIELLSRASLGVAPSHGEMLAFTSNAPPFKIVSQATSTQLQTTLLETARVPQTLTNFGPLQPLPVLPPGSLPPGCTVLPATPSGQASPAIPFAPPLALFNPSLGQLVAVHVNTSATLLSDITSQNTSTSSGASITGYTLGAFSLDGLGPKVTFSGSSTTPTVDVKPYPTSGPRPNFQNDGTTAFFNPLTFTKTQRLDFTQPSDLAFFTASNGRMTISPTLSATAQSGACAPNGNLQTLVSTKAEGLVTITYDYICPTVLSVVRYGIHHQPTQLNLRFSGALNPADAQNVSNYTIIVPNRNGNFTGPGVTTMPITSAVYDPRTMSVMLTTRKQLNVHHLFELRVQLPCYPTPTIIEFGGRNSLGGFHNHRGQFVPVVGGRYSRY
ncbi:MAG: hypothetical protein NVSMB9_12130 [Isosphaeraceae bacterium]